MTFRSAPSKVIHRAIDEKNRQIRKEGRSDKEKEIVSFSFYINKQVKHFLSAFFLFIPSTRNVTH
jgi:hypothetical protein